MPGCEGMQGQRQHFQAGQRGKPVLGGFVGRRPPFAGRTAPAPASAPVFGLPAPRAPAALPSHIHTRGVRVQLGYS